MEWMMNFIKHEILRPSYLLKELPFQWYSATVSQKKQTNKQKQKQKQNKNKNNKHFCKVRNNYLINVTNTL